MKMFEQFDDYDLDDIFGQEINIGDKVRILPKMEKYIGTDWPKKFLDYIGEESVVKGTTRYGGVNCYLLSPNFNKDRDPNVINYIIPQDSVEKIK